jgi:hypothetical protein
VRIKVAPASSPLRGPSTFVGQKLAALIVFTLWSAFSEMRALFFAVNTALRLIMSAARRRSWLLVMVIA